MRNGASLFYPRWLIRTSRSSAILLVVECLVFVPLIAVRAATSARPVSQFWPLLLLAVMAAVAGARLISVLQHLETDRSAPDDVRLRIFDLTLLVPVIGFLGILIALRWA